MHENLKHTLKQYLTKKFLKNSRIQTATTNNGKHFFRFHINQYWQFQEVATKWYYALFRSSYQTILTLLESYHETTVNIFRVRIKYHSHFQGVTPKQYYTLFQTSINTEIFRESLANNTTNFSKACTKQYWHFQRVTD